MLSKAWGARGASGPPRPRLCEPAARLLLQAGARRHAHGALASMQGARPRPGGQPQQSERGAPRHAAAGARRVLGQVAVVVQAVVLLQLQAVLLQVARHVLARQPLHVHQLRRAAARSGRPQGPVARAPLALFLRVSPSTFTQLRRLCLVSQAQC